VLQVGLGSDVKVSFACCGASLTTPIALPRIIIKRIRNTRTKITTNVNPPVKLLRNPQKPDAGASTGVGVGNETGIGRDSACGIVVSISLVLSTLINYEP